MLYALTIKLPILTYMCIVYAHYLVKKQYCESKKVLIIITKMTL